MKSVLRKVEEWFDTNPDGWTTPEFAELLVATVFSLRPKVCLEVGVWGGRSLIPVAMALKALDYGMIIGVDPWSAAESVKGQTGANREWWDNQAMHDQVRSRFDHALTMFQLHPYVVIERKPSGDVNPPVSIDFLNIDGNHGETATHDVVKFAKRVSPGGMCYLDDIDWDGGTVTDASKLLESYGFKRVYNIQRGAMFQRK